MNILFSQSIEKETPLTQSPVLPFLDMDLKYASGKKWSQCAKELTLTLIHSNRLVFFP